MSNEIEAVIESPNRKVQGWMDSLLSFTSSLKKELKPMLIKEFPFKYKGNECNLTHFMKPVGTKII
jgi:hypothetical protein